MPVHSRFFISYIILFLPLIASSKTIKINNLSQLNQDYTALCKDYFPKDILVIFSIKNIIFKPIFPNLTQLGNNQIKQLYKIWESVNSSNKLYLDTLLLTEYHNKLLDPTLPKIIGNIQNTGSPVIAFDNGLTGNFNNIKNLEIWKADYLKSFNINLQDSFRSSEYLIFNNLEAFEGTYPVFYQGILSSNNIPIFQLLLNFLLEVKYMPKIIMMVSSENADLSVVEKQLENYNDNLAFIGYHLPVTESMVNLNDFIKIVEELAKKLNLVKRHNLPSKKKINENPYDNKK